MIRQLFISHINVLSFFNFLLDNSLGQWPCWKISWAMLDDLGSLDQWILPLKGGGLHNPWRNFVPLRNLHPFSKILHPRGLPPRLNVSTLTLRPINFVTTSPPRSLLPSEYLKFGLPPPKKYKDACHNRYCIVL